MPLPGRTPTDAQIDEAERRKAAGLPPWTWDQYCRRKRHVRFVEQFFYEWLATKNVTVASMRAARAVFNNGRMTKKAAAKKGMDMIRRPDICTAVEKAFEENGFSFKDVVEMHIKHIKGEFKRSRAIVVKDGKDKTHVEIVEETLEPNYPALRDLENLIIHKPPQKFQFENTSKAAHVGGVLSGQGVPEMATDDYPEGARVLGPAHVEDADEAEVQTDD